MGQIFFILIPILVIDVLNPILLAGTIFSLGSRHPIVHSLAVLGSYLATYFLAGVLIAVGLEQFENVFRIPPGFDYTLELIVAALLFYFAWNQYKEGDTHPEEELHQEKKMGVGSYLFLGLQINLVGLPFAIPYLAAIDQILKAELNVIPILWVLFVYNILYVFPYFLLIPLRLFYKNQSDTLFESINNRMHKICTKYMPILFLILGLLLVEDAVSYLLGYREYSLLSLI